FRAAFLLGCVGAWSLHPVQIEIAKKVFSPPPEEVKFAKKVLEAIPDGRGVHMIDGKMQDDATWKQSKVMVSLAEMLAETGPERIGRGHFSTILPRMDFRAKDVIASLGITGSELNRLTPILSALARLFLKYDMTLAEINPLAQLEDGTFVAVDAHMDM